MEVEIADNAENARRDSARVINLPPLVLINQPRLSTPQRLIPVENRREQVNEAEEEGSEEEDKSDSDSESSGEEKQDMDVGGDSSESAAEVSSSEEEFDSDGEPDEEVLAVVEQLQERWAAQRVREHGNDTVEVSLPPRFKEVFRFDSNFPTFALWIGSVPPMIKLDYSKFLREEYLIAQGQPARIIDPPNADAYFNANVDITVSHSHANWYPSDFTRAMVAFATDPYFYVDVGVPPPLGFPIPPLPIGFEKISPGIPKRFVNPGPMDPIIPIFFQQTHVTLRLLE